MPKASGAGGKGSGAAVTYGGKTLPITQSQLNRTIQLTTKYRDQADALDEKINSLESKILGLQLKSNRTDAISRSISRLSSQSDALRSRAADLRGQSSKILSNPEKYVKG